MQKKKENQKSFDFRFQNLGKFLTNKISHNLTLIQRNIYKERALS
jgi:hypothetical protein